LQLEFSLSFVILCHNSMPELPNQNKNGLNALSAQYLQKEINFSEHKWLPGYGFKKIGHPEIFQGNKKKKNYFEGWYFKMVSEDDSSILSIIPGIALSQSGKEQHAFIQIIDGKTAKTTYYSFPIEKFAFSREEFAIKIEQNYFSEDKIILNIHTDSSSISGEIQMTDQVRLDSNKIINAGIMGWYRFVPFMECYHGVVSLNHKLTGSIRMDGHEYIFNQGLGYIEKDWGTSMPSAWIWMQSNHFSKGNSSFMLSIANIPWLGKSFTGFLGFFLHDSVLYRFATYTHAKLSLEESGLNTTRVTIRDRKNLYFIEASRNHTGLLKAPVKGSMDRRIPESIDAQLLLTVTDRKGRVIFCDSTSIGGLEMVGDHKILTRSLKKA
jgi:tocopherol cyclase